MSNNELMFLIELLCQTDKEMKELQKFLTKFHGAEAIVLANQIIYSDQGEEKITITISSKTIKLLTELYAKQIKNLLEK